METVRAPPRANSSGSNMSHGAAIGHRVTVSQSSTACAGPDVYNELEPLNPLHPIPRPTPIVRADGPCACDTSSGATPRRMAEFLVDFGFMPLSNADGRQFLRAHDDGFAIQCRNCRGEHDSFVGFALAASSEDDLQRLSTQTGTPLERDDRPGGRWRVRLRDSERLCRGSQAHGDVSETTKDR